MTTKKLNRFLLFRLPAAFFCGVRVYKITETLCEVRVRYRWINTNPFKSMYFAVQSMAAELSTGALILNAVAASGKPISTLVTEHTGSFSKKAIGTIRFVCTDGPQCEAVIRKAIETGEGQKITMRTVGVNEQGIEVSNYQFEWSLKLKQNKKNK